jgi:hypothetical protein
MGKINGLVESRYVAVIMALLDISSRRLQDRRGFGHIRMTRQNMAVG